jgi:glyoxylase-like metal-dependent hydrolase (beta-lactamase superfamily II)
MIEVFPIHSRTGRCYLVRENTSLMLIDAGYRGSFSRIRSVMEENQLEPADVSVIIITHVHHDHVGGLAQVKHHSGAPVMVHTLEAITLERGEVPIPEGTFWLSRIVAFLGRTSLNRLLGYPPVKPDILVEDIIPLHRFGFTATVLPTPGHTRGSLSVLFGSGEAFVGDACVHFPWKETVFPWFANDICTLIHSWKTLLGSEALIFYPGHGAPFTRQKLEQSFQIVSKKYPA